MKGVEECSISVEPVFVRSWGEYRSKNVGMSSKKAGENPAHRKSKVSWATAIDPGLGGPNRSPEKVRGMDECVNIRTLLYSYLSTDAS